MTRWLSIVGIGEDGYDALTPAARNLVELADLLVGGKRHLAMVSPSYQATMEWPSPIYSAIDKIAAEKKKNICILATGDPFCYGIGRLIAGRIPMSKISVLPAPSAYSLACARLGWSIADIDMVTLHGRPNALLTPAIQPNAKLLILSQNSETPFDVAASLTARGFGGSEMTVLERLGGAKERVRTALAEGWNEKDTDPLNVVAVNCKAGASAQIQSRLAALPDDAFTHDGQLTKQETRAATLAALGPAPGQLLWDVGAGSGSVGIEWMRRDSRSKAIAIETNADRLNFIAKNAIALGTPHLTIIAGKAPAVLAGLAAPDAVFIGGGLSTDGVFQASWEALKPGGILVANVVTLESENTLFELRKTHGGELKRIAVSRAETVGTMTGWKPLMAVTQWCVTKPFGGATA